MITCAGSSNVFTTAHARCLDTKPPSPSSTKTCQSLLRIGVESTGAPIALVAYGRENLNALCDSGLGFVVVGHNF